MIIACPTKDQAPGGADTKSEMLAYSFLGCKITWKPPGEKMRSFSSS